MKEKILQFLATNPSYEQIELFYVCEILPHTKNSIDEILAE